MDKRFDSLLDECLGQIIAGEQTIEDCLETHPEQAAELEPLLRVALSLRQTSSLTAPYGARERIGYRVQQAFRQQARPGAAPRALWHRRWVGVVVGLLVLLLASSGTVVASTSSLPDQPLYSVKLATEQVQISLTPRAIARAQLRAKFIERRIEEQRQMAQRGRIDEMETLNRRLMVHLDYIESISDNPLLSPAERRELVRLRQRINNGALKHQAIYEEMLKQATGPAKPRLNEARDKLRQRYQNVLRSLNRDGGGVNYNDGGKGKPRRTWGWMFNQGLTNRRSPAL